MDGRIISASDLIDRVDLLEPTTIQDAANADVTTYAVAATVHAEVERGSGREFIASEALQNEKRMRVKIRSHADLSKSWRIRWNGADFQIHDVAPIARNKGLILSCVEVI